MSGFGAASCGARRTRACCAATAATCPTSSSTGWSTRRCCAAPLAHARDPLDRPGALPGRPALRRRAHRGRLRRPADARLHRRRADDEAVLQTVLGHGQGALRRRAGRRRRRRATATTPRTCSSLVDVEYEPLDRRRRPRGGDARRRAARPRGTNVADVLEFSQGEPRRRCRPRRTCCASASRPSATPGMPMETRGVIAELGRPHRRDHRVVRRPRCPTASSATSQASLGLAENAIRVVAPGRRRRLRRQAPDLSRGDADRQAGDAHPAAGQVGRGPLGALRRDHARARAVPRRRGRLRRRRPHPRDPRPLRHEHRRLPAEPDPRRAVHRRGHAQRPLRHRALRGPRRDRDDEQDADEPVPRRRPRPGGVHHGAHRRLRRRRPRARPGRGAAAQHDHPRPDAGRPRLRQRAGGHDRLRLGRLPRVPAPRRRAGRLRRLPRRAGAPARGGAPRRHRDRLLRRGDGPWAVRERDRAHRALGPGRRPHRRVQQRPGARDHARADRRRRARRRHGRRRRPARRHRPRPPRRRDLRQPHRRGRRSRGAQRRRQGPPQGADGRRPAARGRRRRTSR